MNSTITITPAQFKKAIKALAQEWFLVFTSKYFRLHRDAAEVIFPMVIESVCKRIQMGEVELLDDLRRTIEKAATKEIVKYFKNEIPELAI